MANFQNLRNFNIEDRNMRTAYSYPPNDKISPVHHVNNTPAVTPNINPPQTSHFGNFDISNVCNSVNAFNSSCSNFSPFGNSSHAMNTNYQCQESSLQQPQKLVFEVPGFPGYKVELVFTPIKNQQSQSAQSYNCGGTNNCTLPYMPGDDYCQQSSVITNMLNYQNFYNPSQQVPVFPRYEIPSDNSQSNCSSVNNFTGLCDDSRQEQQMGFMGHRYSS